MNFCELKLFFFVNFLNPLVFQWPLYITLSLRFRVKVFFFFLECTWIWLISYVFLYVKVRISERRETKFRRFEENGFCKVSWPHVCLISQKQEAFIYRVCQDEWNSEYDSVWKHESKRENEIFTIFVSKRESSLKIPQVHLNFLLDKNNRHEGVLYIKVNEKCGIKFCRSRRHFQGNRFWTYLVGKFSRKRSTLRWNLTLRFSFILEGIGISFCLKSTKLCK